MIALIAAERHGCSIILRKLQVRESKMMINKPFPWRSRLTGANILMFINIQWLKFKIILWHYFCTLFRLYGIFWQFPAQMQSPKS